MMGSRCISERLSCCPSRFGLLSKLGQRSPRADIADFSVQQNFSLYVYTGEAPVSVFFFCSVEEKFRHE